MVTFVGFRGSLAERFERKTIWEPNSGCLLWTGSATPDGYGYLLEGSRVARASHVALRLAGKDVPKGMFALHSCDNPYCVNADHLFVGSHKDNMTDMIAKGRHNFSGLALAPSKRGMNDGKRDQARVFFEDGFGPTFIARATGVHKSTIDGWFRKWGHVPRARKRKAG